MFWSERFLELLARPRWMEAAACRGRTEVMFAESASAEAKRLCAGCPVAEECAAYAAECDASLYGVWAGLDRRDRAQLRREQRDVEAA